MQRQLAKEANRALKAEEQLVKAERALTTQQSKNTGRKCDSLVDSKGESNKPPKASLLQRQASGATGSSIHSQMSYVLKTALSPRIQNQNKLTKAGNTTVSSAKNSKSDVGSHIGSPVAKKTQDVQTEVSNKDLDKYLAPAKSESDKLRIAEERIAKLEEQLRKSEEMRKKEFSYVKAVEEAVQINEEMISKLARRLGPDERTNFQADIIKVELNKILKPLQPQSSFAKMVILKNAVNVLSKSASEIMSGFSLVPTEVMAELKQRLQSDSALKEIADNREMKKAVLDTLQKYIDEDYTDLRKAKVHGPYEISAGNIDSARILPGHEDSPCAMNLYLNVSNKFIRSQSAYNNPTILEPDTPPELKQKIAFLKEIRKTVPIVPEINNFSSHIIWLDHSSNPSDRKLGDQSHETLPTASQHTKKVDDPVQSSPPASKLVKRMSLATLKTTKERPTSTARPSSMTKTLNISTNKSGNLNKVV